MFTSIPGESPNSQDEETNEMIDHIDKNSDENSQSPPPKKKKKSEEIKWKRQKFNSIDFSESHLNPILYFVNLSRKTPLVVFEYFVDATLITKITSESNRYKHQEIYRRIDVYVNNSSSTEREQVVSQIFLQFFGFFYHQLVVHLQTDNIFWN